MMRYVHCDDVSQPLALSTTTTPEPQRGEVLVKVHSFGINRADLLQRSGNYPPPAGESDILGLEVAGEVVELGEQGGQWQLGDKVFGLVPGGGYAEFVRVPLQHLMPLPDGLSMAQGAGVAEVFLTAFQALFWLAQIKPGESVLVHAGASGVGLAAIQLAAERGCEVAVTASNQSKLDACAKAGAAMLINHQEQCFVDVIRQSWGSVDVCIDMVAGDYLNQNLKVMSLDGRIVQLAMMAGRFVPQLDMAKMLAKRIQLIASTLRNRSVDYKAALIADFKQQCMDKFVDGRLVPNIDRVYSVSDINQAHQYMTDNLNIGKLVVSW